MENQSNSIPELSIVTVVFNSKVDIETTLQSVINQSFARIEFIVIDGASTDGTLEIIKDYKDKIDVLVSEPDNGIYDAMNKGLSLATGEWVYFLNSGDVLYSKDTFTSLFHSLPQADLIYGKNEADYGYFKRINEPLEINKLRFGMIFSHQAVIVRTVLLKEKPFDLSYQLSADFEFIYFLYQNGYVFKQTDIVFASLSALGTSEINILKTHHERRKIACQYENGWSKIELNLYYYFVSAKLLLVKFVKAVLPAMVINKLTRLKYSL